MKKLHIILLSTAVVLVGLTFILYRKKLQSPVFHRIPFTLIPNAKNELQRAVGDGDFEKVKKLVEKKKGEERIQYVNIKGGEGGVTPLHNAVWLEHADIVEYLIAHGADVNATTKRQSIPLHFAYNIDIFTFLVEKGADINKCNDQKITPVAKISSIHPKGFEVLRYIVKEKAKNLRKETIMSLLERFCDLPFLDYSKLMLDNKDIEKELTKKNVDFLINKAKKKMQARIERLQKDTIEMCEEKPENTKKFMTGNLKKFIQETKNEFSPFIKMLEDLKTKKK